MENENIKVIMRYAGTLASACEIYLNSRVDNSAHALEYLKDCLEDYNLVAYDQLNRSLGE